MCVSVSASASASVCIVIFYPVCVFCVYGFRLVGPHPLEVLAKSEMTNRPEKVLDNLPRVYHQPPCNLT